MYTPSFKTSATKVPILSKDQLDTIGENLVEDFCPDAMMHPQQIDIDRVNAGLEAVAATFNVSNDAAWYRISELGLMR